MKMNWNIMSHSAETTRDLKNKIKIKRAGPLRKLNIKTKNNHSEKTTSLKIVKTGPFGLFEKPVRCKNEGGYRKMKWGYPKIQVRVSGNFYPHPTILRETKKLVITSKGDDMMLSNKRLRRKWTKLKK